MSHSGSEGLDLLSQVEPTPSLKEVLETETGQAPCYLFPSRLVRTTSGWRMGKIGRVLGWKLLTW